LKALLASDLDGTLVGDPRALRHLLRQIAPLRGELGLVYATGRSLASTSRLLASEGLPLPDALIAEVGAAVHFPPAWDRDQAWTAVLQPRWDPARVRAAAERVPCLVPQPLASQTAYKCSYELAQADAKVLGELAALLTAAGVDARLVYSSGRDLDILPRHAGKGSALRYVASRLGVPPGRILACGDSGNDLDLLAHGGPAALVSNAQPEALAQAPAAVYRARKAHAAGVLEALDRFRWLGAFGPA
jgi:sucrose-6F-phosphate phosphohydrolase